MNGTVDGVWGGATSLPTSDIKEEEWQHASRLAAVFSIVLALVGITGNLLTIIALSRNSKLVRHATTVFVINLSCSDLLFCSLNLPLTAARYVGSSGRWALGDTLCQLYPFFFYGNVGVSLLSMVCITLNRYVLIVHHQYYERVYRRRYLVIMLLLCWLLSFSFLLPPLLGAWGKLGHNPQTDSCTILRDENDQSPKKFLFVLGFAVPCLVIIFSYSAIYWLVCRSSRRLRLRSSLNTRSSMSHSSPTRSIATTTSIVLSENNNSSVSNGIPQRAEVVVSGGGVDSGGDGGATGGGVGRVQKVRHSSVPKIISSFFVKRENANPTTTVGEVERRKGMKKKKSGGSTEDMKVTRMMLIIFCAFLICFLPLTIMNAAVKEDEMPLLHTLASICAWMSAVINPFIYALMNRRYRLAYVRLVTPCKRQLVRKWWLSSTNSNNQCHQQIGMRGGGEGSNHQHVANMRGSNHVQGVGGHTPVTLTSGSEPARSSTNSTECTRVAETRLS